MLPSNLDEAIDILKIFLKEHLDSIKEMDERTFLANTHSGAGRFIRNNWNLWWYPDNEHITEKPELVDYFHSIDIYHADDMSGIIFLSFHRHLNGVDLNIPAQVERYKSHWRNYGYADGIPRGEK